MPRLKIQGYIPILDDNKFIYVYLFDGFFKLYACLQTNLVANKNVVSLMITK